MGMGMGMCPKNTLLSNCTSNAAAFKTVSIAFFHKFFALFSKHISSWKSDYNNPLAEAFDGGTLTSCNILWQQIVLQYRGQKSQAKEIS